jgi:hypothetical protein
MTTAVKPRRARRRHGLGASGVAALVESQGGACAVCGTPYADEPGKRLAVDHDHRHCPGKIGCPQCIRGLLCNACNNLLRLAGEDPERLRKAAAYLERASKAAFWWEASHGPTD